MPDFNYQNIPEELRNLKQWGNFQLKWIPERKKNTKLPINAYDGTAGKSNEPSTWSDFDTALRGLDKIERADGLSFYFANGYVGLDIDSIDDDLYAYLHGDGSDANIVNRIKVLTKNTYMEVSQSGKGIHAIFKGKIPGKHRRKGQYEMYEKGRFFALTGNTIGKTDIQSLNQSEMKRLYEYLFGKDKIIPFSPSNELQSFDLSVPEIIKRAEASRTGKRFDLFMKGGWEQFYNSQSEADMAFANDLAFWCGRDFHKMDTIFRNSSLMRDKYDSKRGDTTYGISLLNKAINETTNTFDPEKPETKYQFNFLNEKKEQPKKHFSQDDMGNAERFLNDFPHRFKYSYVDKRWYYYNGSYWQFDDMGYVEKAADLVPKMMLKEPLVVDDESKKDEAKKKWYKFISKTRSNASKKNMLSEVKHHVSVGHDEFDKNDMLLNTPSGYVDLTNGEIHDHNYKKMFARSTNAEYSDSIDCPLWIQFVHQIMGNNEEMVHYLQKMIGYCATGSTAEQKMFIAYGNGRNGKSVMFDTVQNVMGGYSRTMNVETIMAKASSSSSQANSDIARLENARFVLSSEANEGSRLDEGLVKQMTGGDKLVARYQYGSEFEFTPKFKILMATNHVPLIRGTDEGIWRRLVLIPFDVQIPEDKVDPQLKYKLEAESMGILNWIVQGAIMWQQEGLKEPEIIRSASHAYRGEMDTVLTFMSEQCDFAETYSVKARDLYHNYKTWAESTGNYLMSETKFGKKMAEKINDRNLTINGKDVHLDKRRSTNGNYYLGLRIHEKYPGLNSLVD